MVILPLGCLRDIGELGFDSPRHRQARVDHDHRKSTKPHLLLRYFSGDLVDSGEWAMPTVRYLSTMHDQIFQIDLDRHKKEPGAVNAPRASTGCCLSL